MPVVNLIKYIRVDDKWKFAPVQKINGAFKATHVLLSGKDGKAVKTDDGVFYLEWSVGGKRKREGVGKSPRAALDALENKQAELNLAEPKTEDTKKRSDLTIAEACKRFLLSVKATKSAGTHKSYGQQTRWFTKHIEARGKRFIKDVDREDILYLFSVGRDEGSDQKTINKRIVVILSVIRNAGHDVTLNKGDWPKTADPDPEVYTLEELKEFFAVCDEREYALFQTFLHTGFRQMEVATLRKKLDINWADHTLRVSIKPDLDFNPKSYEWRSVRVPKQMIDILKSWVSKESKHSDETTLVFPSPVHPLRPKYGGVLIDHKMLDTCKKIAKRAGLDPANWYLHKFRHTYATNMLRSGVDIRTLQSLLGHKSLATTEKYLKALRLHDLEMKIESGTLTALF